MRNCVDSAQDRDYWRFPMKAALNLSDPYAMELVIEAESLQDNMYLQVRKYVMNECKCWTWYNV